jgi:outer membrane protein assembly factor BamA
MNIPLTKLWLPLLCVCATHGALDIRLNGNSFLPKHKILESISTDPEEWNEDGLRSWQEDAEFNVADLYRRSGFFEIQVKTALRKKSETPQDMEAEITLVEGPRYLFDSVRVVAQTSISAVDTLKNRNWIPPVGPQINLQELEARAGLPYQEDAMLKDRRLLLRRYGDAGFVRAEVNHKPDVRFVTKTVAVDYLVDPAYPVVFDTLVLRNTRAPPADTAAGITREKLIRSLVPYTRGDTVRISMSDKLIEKLQYTGAFNYVRFKDSIPMDTSRGSILFLYAEEHVPGNVHGSIFLETQYGPGISLDARHSNLSGTLNEVRVGSALALARQNMYVGYGNPLPFGYLIRFDDDADVAWYQDKVLHAEQGLFGGDFRAANSSRLTFPIAYWLRLVANAEIEAKSRMLGAGLRERDLNLNFIQTGFLSFLNNQMDPTRGLRFALTWGNGGPLVKGNVFDITEFRHNWLEVQTAQYYYFPQLQQVKLATRLDGGRFFGAGGSNSERFFLGGSRSVRSFDFQSLCLEKTPGEDGTGADGACRGQEQSLAYYLASAELRFEPFDFGFIDPRSKWHYLLPIQLVPFVDYANVWALGRDFKLDVATDIKTSGRGYAYGLGIRYPLLGIFNLRMDFTRGNGPIPFWLDLAQAF